MAGIAKLNGYTGWVIAVVAVITMFFMGVDRLTGLGIIRQQITQSVKNDLKHDAVDEKHSADIVDLKVLAGTMDGKLDTLLDRTK